MRSEKEIEMIKRVRCLTNLLGKLGIQCMLQAYSPVPNYGLKSLRPSTYYGLSVKEAADYTHNYLVRTGQKDDKLIPTRIRHDR